jgi:aspartate aminotransferase
MKSCQSLSGRVSAGGALLQSDEDVALALLTEQGVGTVHGSAFGLGPYLRIAYALDDHSLQQACRASRQGQRATVTTFVLRLRKSLNCRKANVNPLTLSGISLED